MNALAALPLKKASFLGDASCFYFCQGSIGGYLASVKDESVDGATDTICSKANGFSYVQFGS